MELVLRTLELSLHWLHNGITITFLYKVSYLHLTLSISLKIEQNCSIDILEEKKSIDLGEKSNNNELPIAVKNSTDKPLSQETA